MSTIGTLKGLNFVESFSFTRRIHMNDFFSNPSVRLNNIYISAKRRKKDFKLNIDHIKNMYKLNNGTCDYTGVRFSTEIDNENYPSVDRIDPLQGYIPGNIIFCTRHVNWLKQAFFENSDTKFLPQEHLHLCNLIFKKLSNELESFSKKYLLPKDKAPKLLITNCLENYENLRKNLLQSTQDFVNMKNNEIPTKMTISTGSLQSKNHHDDYSICKRYVLFCESKKNSIISYDEFKELIETKVCQFSNKPINKSRLYVLDKSNPLTKDKVMVVDESYCQVLDALKDIPITQMQIFINKLSKQNKE